MIRSSSSIRMDSLGGANPDDDETISLVRIMAIEVDVAASVLLMGLGKVRKYC